MSTGSWLSVAAIALTSAIAVISLIKESQEQREKQGGHPRRWHWYARFALTIAGLLTGIFLVYLGESARKVNENKHVQERDADKLQIAGLSQSIETQTQNNETQYLRHQQELRALQDQVSDLKKDIATKELRTRMGTLQARLESALAPKPKAKLECSFWSPGAQAENLTEIYAPAEGNIVTFSFYIMNRSDVYAKDISLWLRICDDCKFHKEPELSQRVPGSPDSDRLFKNFDLAAGVAFQKITVEMEVPPPFTRAGIGTKYRCADCEIEQEYEHLWINVGRQAVPDFSPHGPQTTKPKKKP
jgi:hypothetical protein